MTKTQWKVVLWLFGVLLVMMTIYRLEWFYALPAGEWVYQLVVMMGMLLTFCAFGSFFGKKAMWFMLVLLVLLEMSIVASFQLVSAGHALPKTWTHILRYIFIRHDRGNLAFHPGCGQWDEKLFYTLRPGNFEFDVWEFSTSYHVNGAGFRDSELAAASPSVLFLGDSFTMGWGVEQEQGFAKLVGQQLKLPTYNAGVSSYGTARELIALQEMKFEKMPLIVLQYCQNDDVENNTFVENGFQLPVSSKSEYEQEVRWSWLPLHWYPFKYSHAFLVWAIPNFIEMIKHGTTRTPKVEHQNGGEITDEAVADFFAIVNRIKSLGASNIVIMELRVQETSDSVYNLFDAWLKSHPMEGVHLYPAYQHLDSSCYFTLDDHINKKGHEELAKALTRYINHHNLLNNKD